jgi:hypothetical protein
VGGIGGTGHAKGCIVQRFDEGSKRVERAHSNIGGHQRARINSYVLGENRLMIAQNQFEKL